MLTKKELKGILTEFNLSMLSFEGQKISINKYYLLLKGFLKNRFKYFKEMDSYVNRSNF